MVVVGSRGEVDKLAPGYVPHAPYGISTGLTHYWNQPSSLDNRLLMMKDATVIGFALHRSTPDEVVEQRAYIGAGLTNGSLRPIVAKEFALVDAPKAHDEILHGAHAGKIVLLP